MAPNTTKMTIREELEQREREILAPEAARSADSRGRLRPEPEDPIRPAFQRDRDRVIHCKAFRRLKHKTQVFFAPAGDHYRTRLTHTLEVSQIARSIAPARSRGKSHASPTSLPTSTTTSTMRCAQDFSPKKSFRRSAWRCSGRPPPNGSAAW